MNFHGGQTLGEVVARGTRSTIHAYGRGAVIKVPHPSTPTDWILAGRDVEVLAADEGPAYGAALLAGVGVGVWPSVDEACDQPVRIATRVATDPEIAKLLDVRYGEFRRLYGVLHVRGTAPAR